MTTLPNRRIATSSLASSSNSSCPVRTRVQSDAATGTVYPLITVSDDHGNLIAAYRNETGLNPSLCPHIASATKATPEALLTGILSSLMTPIYKAASSAESTELAIVAALDAYESKDWTTHASDLRVIRPVPLYGNQTPAIVIDGGPADPFRMSRQQLLDIAEWITDQLTELVQETPEFLDRISGRSRPQTAAAVESSLKSAGF